MTTAIRGFKRKGTRKPFWALVRMQLKVRYNPGKLVESLGMDESKRQYGYLYLALVALAFIPFTVMLFRLADSLTLELVRANQPGLAVVIAVLAGQLTVVLFGLSHLMSSMYYSSDLDQLQSFPLKPWQIMYGKVAVVYAGQLVITAFVVAPFLITLGKNLGGAVYWPLALLVYLLIPLVPLGVSLLILVPIMKATAGSRRRDTFRVLLGLVFVVLIFAFQYLNNTMLRYGPETLIARLMERDGLVSTAAGYYPVLKWAAWALTGGDAARQLLGLALYAGVSVGLVNLVISLTQGWFFGGIAPASSGATKKHVPRAGAAVARPRGTMSALILREHRIIARTPNFLLTVLLNLLVLPILVVSMYITGGDAIPQILQTLLGAKTKDVVVLVMLGIHGLFTGMNQVASTAVSREGPMFWMSKLIPVAPKVQMRAKLIYSLLFSLAQLAILAGAAIWFLKLDFVRSVVLIALGILVSAPVSIICLLNDLRSPKVNWTEPQQAMKGNFQTLVAWLFSLLYLGILVLVTRGFLLLGLSIRLLYAVLGALMAVSSYGLLTWLDSAAESVYPKL
ncbi:MAG: hypothetical protein ACOX35_01125 [Bacillota bacterium]